MTHAEIDILEATPDHVTAFIQIQVISDALSTWDYETNGAAFYYPDGVENIWANLVIHPVLLSVLNGTKPTEADLEAGPWASYIAGLRASEDARLAEIARVSAIQTRWDALPDQRLCMNKHGDNRANPAMLLKEIIENDDEVTLAALEAQSTAVQGEIDFSLAELKAGKKRILGQRAITKMLALNDTKSLNHGQSIQMMRDLDDIASYLERGMIDEAIVETQALNPLPSNVSAGERDMIVAFLTAGIATIES